MNHLGGLILPAMANLNLFAAVRGLTGMLYRIPKNQLSLLLGILFHRIANSINSPMESGLAMSMAMAA